MGKRQPKMLTDCEKSDKFQSSNCNTFENEYNYKFLFDAIRTAIIIIHFDNSHNNNVSSLNVLTFYTGEIIRHISPI